MNTLTPIERAEWIKDAKEAILGRKLLRICSLPEAYAALSKERVWRDEPASVILREAYEQMLVDSDQ